MNNGDQAIIKMMSQKERLARLAETFKIPFAGGGEEGTRVLLYYDNGRGQGSHFNGGAPLEDEYPWKLVRPIARYAYQRGMKDIFGLRLIYTADKEYKLQEFILD